MLLAVLEKVHQRPDGQQGCQQDQRKCILLYELGKITSHHHSKQNGAPFELGYFSPSPYSRANPFHGDPSSYSQYIPQEKMFSGWGA
ncbi:hypothetical protein Ppro_2678 [Pelobacter propionicus DSM 2379]|uniref:Uncharacterized protein n=1 Tax=Pelobacter propionicus (strain DSM 2379 / NBRC 103807 / OttBd1) TaxID=338966 RepID=A1ASG1_PELPD|nr:hypothetical protein Ppro_2678 [Pelobacter propionicus DSM 2379]